LPSKFDIYEWSIMDRFRDVALEEVATEFLEAHRIEFRR